MSVTALIARVLAILIAILGVVDPALTSMRQGKPEVALIVTLSSPTSLGVRSEISRRLGDRYAVIPGPWDNAAATIVIGYSLPDRIPSGRVFAVRDTSVAIERFDVPNEVTLESRVPIVVKAPRSLVELRANGAVVARDSSKLLFAPWTPGTTLLEARAIRGRDSASAFAMTHVVDRSHAVLFFDRRPSWMSTFVRRSLEADRRFTVASRVLTSRNVSTAANQAPSTLSDPSLLELYDVIVVGAPTALTASDVGGLEQFLRRRGGAVVLLYDGAPAGGPQDRLTGVTAWTPRTVRNPIAGSAPDDSIALRFTEAAFPVKWSGIQRTIATAPNADSVGNLVWSTTIGSGEVIVSGALDSWKYRDKATSGFDEFWRATISQAAREASQPITVQATPNLARPGEPIALRITVRDTLSRPDVQLDSTSIQLWRSDRPGEYVAKLRAPEQGDHLITAAAGGMQAESPLVVRANIARVPRDQWSTTARLARASGGYAGPLDSVVDAVKARVTSEKHLERWFPMRSGWWILPFVGLLGFEWLVRRRRGLV